MKNNTPLTFAEISEAARKRVELITNEFKDGFEFLRNYPRSVTIFGSSRLKEGDPHYEQARRIAGKIVNELHYSIVTGGGPGIMQAANRGAYEAGGNSLGITIDIKGEPMGEYLTDKINFHYFFTRKVCLSFASEAYLYFPGGFGTLDEFTEILTLVHTAKVQTVPIILVGVDYWQPFEDFLRKSLLERGLIDKEDLEIYTITDDENEIIEIIKNAPVRISEPYKEDSTVPSHSNHAIQNGRTASELARKHCVPCEENTEPMSREESEKMLEGVSQWMLVGDKEIEKTYEFKNFTEAMEFVNTVGRLAENEGHHPDLKIHDYKKVTVKISTHSIGGLSENDFILAAKIDDSLR